EDTFKTEYDIYSYIKKSYTDAGASAEPMEPPVDINLISISQVDQGVLLEHFGHDNRPHSLVTPHGIWYFHFKSQTREDKEIWNNLKNNLGLQLQYEKVLDKFLGGSFGPWYRVTQWGGKKLPEPKQRARSQFLTGEQIKAEWDKFIVNHGISPNKELNA